MSKRTEQAVLEVQAHIAFGFAVTPEMSKNMQEMMGSRRWGAEDVAAHFGPEAEQAWLDAQSARVRFFAAARRRATKDGDGGDG